MNGKQMLDEMVGIQDRYESHRDLESLQIELLDIVPNLKYPGIAGMGDLYRNALDIYNALRQNLPEGTPGIPEIRSNRI
ncbi:MAG: hypothetical protein AABX82_02055 [Nanoarchaeota archaeon]